MIQSLFPTVDPAVASPVIRFRGVGLTYPGPPPVEALRPADLAVERGDYVTVVGPSGSGKSTLLNVAGLLDRATTGVYELDGIDVADLTESQRTALRGTRIGFVFQAYHLLAHRSAVENVMLAMLYAGPTRSHRRQQAYETLERVGLASRAQAPPTQLSGGERQRVAIARALVNRPSLLLCDEPTGNLDSDTAAAVLGLIDELHESGLTVVLITHDLTVARRGQRTITIRDGVISQVAQAGTAQ